ncbi:MAG: N-formylglutamate amidohydrolase [Ahniella sp.]|nr:N-formylglutamate amidohydrolase [Ahniella sp.]
MTEAIQPYHAPFRIIDGPERSILLIAEHASNAVPDELDGLGLENSARVDHIAWDPGVGGVVQQLAGHWRCNAVLGGMSRLVVDLNRGEDDSSLILAESDGIPVPGNIGIDPTERARRIEAYHRPYHARIRAEIDARLAEGIAVRVVSVHSFTPTLDGFSRPWQVGVLWKTAAQRNQAVIEALRARGHFVGDNEPYDGHIAMGFSLDHHGVQRDLWHVMFELRNDLIRTPEAQAYWAMELAEVLELPFLCR